MDASKHSFVILANTFREQTKQEWNDKYLESFGLVTPDGKLTNAGLLFVDNCDVFQSRIFCTRWTGLYKDDAISSVEHRANLVLLLKYGIDFIKNYTMSGCVKMPNYRLNLPDYSDHKKSWNGWQIKLRWSTKKNKKQFLPVLVHLQNTV